MTSKTSFTFTTELIVVFFWSKYFTSVYETSSSAVTTVFSENKFYHIVTHYWQFFFVWNLSCTFLKAFKYTWFFPLPPVRGCFHFRYKIPIFFIDCHCLITVAQLTKYFVLNKIWLWESRIHESLLFNNVIKLCSDSFDAINLLFSFCIVFKINLWDKSVSEAPVLVFTSWKYFL